ncbi:thioredoxin domain-containing protein [Rhodovulum steppense]|uniref:Protein-disulfide isomerase n=1 Tax=Rhodovulum steppense TaxID=540251 RepID=A0A4R1YV11_9RHOB|nr:thioredoxin domain-containing protein [Rhodovulum steppense]TCM84717.1 protein-disulfide isomerase [Rhodovulum steppense]
MRIVLALALAALPLAAAASGLDPAARAAFRAEIRAYLLEHPELIDEVLAEAERQRQAEAVSGDLALIEAHRAALFDAPDDWTGGNPEGDVTVVAFVDYACDRCGPALSAARALAASDPGLRLVVKDAPGPGGETAARFARAVLALAGPDAYARAQDALFAAPDMQPGTLDGIARALGLDPATVADRMADPGIAAALAVNRALLDALDLETAPAYVFERSLVRGDLPEVALAAIAQAMRRKN